MDIKKIFFRNKNLQSETDSLAENATLKDKIITAIRTVYDPEIHVNVYDLGLIYQINIKHETKVAIKMTLTAPACPVAEILPVKVSDAVKLVDGVSDVKVDLVWEPAWNNECISDEARLSLGLF